MRPLLLAIASVVFGAQPIAWSAQPKTSQLELERLEARFRNETIESILRAQGWTFAHAASEQGKKEALAVFDIGMAEGKFSLKKAIEGAGGLDAYRKKVTTLLENKDEVVRGFAAVWLGVLGQKESVPDLLKLLQSKLPAQDEFSEGADRGRAALALGLLGAQEHAPKLATLLSSNNPNVRSGAAYGLGHMKALKFAPDVAKLIKQAGDPEPNDGLMIAGAAALAQMGAHGQAEEIAWILKSDQGGDPSVKPAAMYALVKLKAKEHAKDIAPYLADEFKKRDAALALALMNAQSYKKQIAALLDDENPLIRSEGMIALGILRAREYEDKIAAHLKDREGFVEWYAGWSLILMESEKHISKIVSEPDMSALSVTGQGVRQIAIDEFREVRERAIASWRKLQVRQQK